MRLVLVPRWSGDATSGWMPWLLGAMRAGCEDIRVARLLPEKGAPAIGPCVDEVRSLLGSEPRDVVLVGHSVGAQAAMHAFVAIAG